LYYDVKKIPYENVFGREKTSKISVFFKIGIDKFCKHGYNEPEL
jgi:hypothetical protein